MFNSIIFDVFQVILGVLGDKASAEVRSGALCLERPLSTGMETYDTDKTQWPITQPMTKKKAIMQVQIILYNLV